MLTLTTPLVELHLHGLPRIGQLTAHKLAVEIAAITAKPDAREANIEDLLHYLPMRYEDRSNLARIADPGAEFRSRVRMTLRSFAGTLSMRRAYVPTRSRKLFVAVLSHKLMRWLTPYFLIAATASNVVLLDRPVYKLSLCGQLVGYTCGLVGYLGMNRGIKIPVASSIFSFCLINSAWLIGSAKALLGHRRVVYHSED